MILELSARNPRVADVRASAAPKGAAAPGSSRFVVETPKLVLETLESGLAVDFVIVPGDQHPDPDVAERCDEQGVRLFGLDAEAFAKLADARTPQPALAVVEAPTLTLDDRFHDVGNCLVLVDVSDPGNVGTLIRTAEAAGCRGVIVTPSTADVLSPKVVRSSAGSMLRVPIAEVELDDLGSVLDELGMVSLATAMDGMPMAEIELDDDKPVAVMLGSEAHGLDESVAAHADVTVAIPMHGKVESLNVAVSGAILLYGLLPKPHGW